MANEKVRFLSGPLTAITGNNPPAIQVGQLLFAVEQKGTNGPYYGSIYYDYAAGKRILMGQSLAFKGDTILNVTRNNTTGETEFSHTGRGLIFTVIGTQTATTGAWTGTLNDLPNVSAMYDGLSILYYLPVAGSGNATLQLKFADGSESAAIPVYYTANSRCTTHYGAGSTIRLTYWTAGKKLGSSTTTDDRWTANEYNSDDIVTQQETYTLVTAGTAGIMRYSLVMRDKDGKYQSLTTKTPTGSNSTALNDSARATDKVVNTTAEFVLGPVFYMNRSSELANNGLGGTSQVRTFCSLIDWRYTFNCGTTLTKNSPILIKGTINANGYFQLVDTGYTQTWPTTDDGYVYILVGQTYSDNAGYRGDFWGGIATAYVYKNGGLRTYTGYANKAGDAVNAVNAIKDNSGNTIDETYIASIGGTNNSGTTDYIITPVNGKGANQTALNVPINQISSDAKTSTKLFLIGATAQSAAAKPGYSHVNYYIGTDNKLHGTTFVGALEGNASSATSATSAAKDSEGHQFTTTYLYKVSGAANGLNYKLTFETFNNQEAYVINVPQNKVGNKVTTSKMYLIGVNNTSTTDTVAATNADANATITNGVITALGFVGPLTGDVTGNVTGSAGSVAWANITDAPNQLVQGAAGTTATDKYTIQLYNISGAAIAANNTAAQNGVITIPAADTNKAGLITTAAQTIAGKKTFNGGIIAKTDNDFISHSNEFNFAPALTANMEIHINHRTAGTNTTNTKITRYHFKDGNGGYAIVKASSFEGNLTWSNLTNVPQIVEGALGENTGANYKIQLYNLAGAAIGTNAGVATNGVINVPINLVSSESKINTKLYLVGVTSQSTSGQTGYSNDYFYIDTTNKLHGTFVGDVTGNLTGNADTATKATQDAAGNNIQSTYISDITISGHTLTFTNGQGGTTDRSLNYVQLSGDTITGTINRYYTAANGSAMFTLRSNNQDATFVTMGHASSATGTISNGYEIVYNGAGSAPNNLFKLVAIASASSKTVAMTVNEAGNVTFTNTVAADISGLAAKANQDNDGHVIHTTYLSTASGAANGLNYKLTFGRPNNASAIEINVPQNTVGNKKVTTKLYWVGVASTSTTDTVAATNTDAAIYATNGVLTATKFVGALQGDVTGNVSGTAGSVAWSNITDKPQIVQGGAGTTATTNYKIQLYDVNGAAIAANNAAAQNGVITIPGATTSQAGLMTTDEQSFVGAKTFSTSISTPTLTVTGSGGFNYSGMQAGTTNADRIVWFSDNSAIGKPVYDNDFKYNPSTNTLKLVNITASGAVAAASFSLSGGNDSTHSTEDATLKITGGASISMRLSAKMVRIDNGDTSATKGFNLIYNPTEECLEFQFGN